MKVIRTSICTLGLIVVAGACHNATKGSATPSDSPGGSYIEGGREAYPAADRVETAASAASIVASMPEITSVRARQEILLQAALYRASLENNVGDFTRHFLLQPVEDTDPPNLGIEPGEFRLRVLAQLADLNVPIAWLPETWRTVGVDRFPGTDQRATRLRIKITQRDENKATVVGEVSDVTADVGASRQGVIATWDGSKWNIERDRVRLVW